MLARCTPADSVWPHPKTVIDLRAFRDWAQLTKQPFIGLVQQGKVSTPALKRWLAQEQYLYEAELKLLAVLLQHAPRHHRLILANAVLMAVEELDWLAELELPQSPPHVACRDYLAFWSRLQKAPYAQGLLAFWARKRAFFEAWRVVGYGGTEELVLTLSQHWLAPEAQALLHDLGSLTMELSAEIPTTKSSELVAQVLRLEQAAWAMAHRLQKESPSSLNKEGNFGSLR